MKKITLSILALAIGASVHAQGPRPNMDHTKLPASLVTQLKLTADQQTKVTSILTSKSIIIDSLIKKANVGPNRRTAVSIKSAETEANDQLYALFSKDQQLVYAQWILDRRAAMQKRGPKPAPSM